MANDEQIVSQNDSNSKIAEISEMPTRINSGLKRKRPPKIKIPNVLCDISAEILEAQEQGSDVACVWFGDCGVGVFSLKGKKRFMEDAHKIVSSSNGTKEFFGVYDGHCGSKASKFVAENLHLKIFEMLETCSENIAKEEAIKVAYLKTDEEFLKQGFVSGSCCVTAVIEGHEMVVSNSGDCRAVLSRGGKAEALTTDHRPTREDEQRRILAKGGYVGIHHGTWRVDGTHAVSRSIGDANLKEWVIADPDTKIISLTSDMEYLVLASDGLWDKVGNQEAIDIVMKLCLGGKKRIVRSSQQKKESPLSKSPRVSLVSSKRIQSTGHDVSTVLQKRKEDGICSENISPPSKAQKISSVKKIKNNFHSDENECLVEKPGYGDELVDACKELANLAVARGSLDDVTVMIVDLSHYKVSL